MGSVGLLYVGAVLAVNGLMLLGYVEARSAAPLNLFVGALQVVTPTYLIFTAGGDEATILAASGLYLFGFTYLYVGINLLAGLDGTGLGWFSGFVALAAVVYAGLNFFYVTPRDPAFGVIWLYWAVLWGLFLLTLGLRREEFTRYTGGVALVAGIVTAAIPAFLLLTGQWTGHVNQWAVALAVIEVASLLLLIPLRTRWTAPAQLPESEPVVAGEVPGPRGSAPEDARRSTGPRVR
ncbi:MAG: AmiS/UreI family transporter [Friedmanniella sp.]